MQKLKLVKSRKISYKDEQGNPKPVLIITNPNSGKHLDLSGQISRRLEAAGVPFEFMQTQQYLDTYMFAKNTDLS